MKETIFKKSVRFITVIFLLLSLSISLLVYNQYEKINRSELRHQADDILNIESIEDFSKSLESVTIYNHKGKQLYGTRANTNKNLGQKEIEELKLRAKSYEEDSLSSWFDKEVFYYDYNTDILLIISQNQAKYLGFLISIIPQAIIIYLFLLVLTYFYAYKLSEDLCHKVNSIELSANKPQPVLSGLEPLSHKIMMYNDDLMIKIKELNQEKIDFIELLNLVNEGFIVLDQDNKIVSYNQKAQEIFNIDDDSLGITVYNRDPILLYGLEEVKALRDFSSILELDDSYYQLIMNTVSKESYQGVIIALLDITEQKHYEDLKREFAANVSHELKTPLTTIMGTSEMLRSGMVDEADTDHFIDNIYHEAVNMQHLIDDIIKISKLDEKKISDVKSNLSLKAEVKGVLQQLQNQYDLSSYQIDLFEDDLMIVGIEEVLRDILYNALENAIKYNNQKYYIKIDAKQEYDYVTLSIYNSGEAIKDFSRVFERFYREREQSVQGSGLGLAIIKNGMNLIGHGVNITNHQEGVLLELTFTAAKV